LIVVDTSALCAILFAESDADYYDDMLFRTPQIAIAAPTLFEFLMVAEGRGGESARRQAEELISLAQIRIVAWDESKVTIAQDAFRRYGKGQGHPAQLNFGDCMSYALAKALDAPLLYKGGGFALTDIVAAA
jgi:ribonuclease VapC